MLKFIPLDKRVKGSVSIRVTSFETIFFKNLQLFNIVQATINIMFYLNLIV